MAARWTVGFLFIYINNITITTQKHTDLSIFVYVGVQESICIIGVLSNNKLKCSKTDKKKSYI